ncbi:MAG TPA: plasmid stabilization protein [Pelagibacterium sp.]|nr:plasmid stabilization protein [Pelagibacterium sp.]|tara:strand:- start:25 stop:273 length:249 start_codon:yes stop_codon:yes gene_type:complete
MVQPQLSVRSAKARDLAHRLAQREQRTVADIVERALAAYAERQHAREPAVSFYERLSRTYASDVDLDTIIKDHRTAHKGLDL